MSARQWRRIILFLLFGIAQCVFLFAYVFVVRFVTVEGNVCVPSADIAEAASLKVGEYYWSYLLQGIPQRVESLPLLQSASLHLRPMGVVAIVVRERPAVAQVATGNRLHPWAYIADNGYVLGPADDENASKSDATSIATGGLAPLAGGNGTPGGVAPLTGGNSALSGNLGALPKIHAFHNIPLGGRLPQEVVDDVMLVHPACQEYFGDDLVGYSVDASERLTVQIKMLGHHTNILLGDAKKFAEKEELMRAMIEMLRKQGVPVKQVDLRFANAVVTLVEPPKPTPSPSPEPEATEESTPEDVPVEYYSEGEADIAPADSYESGGGTGEPVYDDSSYSSNSGADGYNSYSSGDAGSSGDSGSSGSSGGSGSSSEESSSYSAEPAPAENPAPEEPPAPAEAPAPADTSGDPAPPASVF